MSPLYFYRTAAAATAPTARGHAGPWCTRFPSSERDVVVEVSRRRGRFVLGVRRARARSGVAATAHAAARTRAAAVQQQHLGGDDLRGLAILNKNGQPLP